MPETEKMMRRPEVERVTGLSRSTIYAWQADGRFPRPVRLGARLVAWRASDVAAWLADRETAE